MALISHKNGAALPYERDGEHGRSTLRQSSGVQRARCERETAIEVTERAISDHKLSATPEGLLVTSLWWTRRLKTSDGIMLLHLTKQTSVINPLGGHTHSILHRQQLLLIPCCSDSLLSKSRSNLCAFHLVLEKIPTSTLHRASTVASGWERESGRTRRRSSGIEG